MAPTWLATLVDLVARLVGDAYSRWLARRDTITAAQSEVITRSLEEALDVSRTLADDAARPRTRADVTDRLRDGTF